MVYYTALLLFQHHTSLLSRCSRTGESSEGGRKGVLLLALKLCFLIDSRTNKGISKEQSSNGKELYFSSKTIKISSEPVLIQKENS